MKKIVSMFAIVAFLFSVNANATTEPTKDKKKKAKTEKSCTKEEKKSCGTEKKAGCCAHKMEEKKS